MFDHFRDRLQTVQHDLSQGWKSIADKAKAVNKKIVRKTTFITDELVETDDPCFSCNLEAGSEILRKYQKEWAHLHESSKDCAQRAQRADHFIGAFSRKCSDLHSTMTLFHGELSLLPEVIKNIETAKADIDAIGSQLEVLDNLMMDLEEVCEQLDLARRKSAQGLKLSMLRHNREDDLDVLKEELQSAREMNEVKLQHLERQASIEKQQVYEDAFIEQMNYYIQHGKTEEPISTLHIVGSSLADITLEDDSDHQELDDFLGSVNEVNDSLLGGDADKPDTFMSSEDEEWLQESLKDQSTDEVQQEGKNAATESTESGEQ